MAQSYQQVSKIITEDLKRLKKLGIENVSSYYKNKKVSHRAIDIQKYYFKRQSRFPEKYERLYFNTNGAPPSSKTLSEILFDFKCYGILDFEGNILI